MVFIIVLSCFISKQKNYFRFFCLKNNGTKDRKHDLFYTDYYQLAVMSF